MCSFIILGSNKDGGSESTHAFAATDTFLTASDEVEVLFVFVVLVVVVVVVLNFMSLVPQCWRGKCLLARAERSSLRKECSRRYMRKVRGKKT